MEAEPPCFSKQCRYIDRVKELFCDFANSAARALSSATLTADEPPATESLIFLLLSLEVGNFIVGCFHHKPVDCGSNCDGTLSTVFLGQGGHDVVHGLQRWCGGVSHIGDEISQGLENWARHACNFLKFPSVRSDGGVAFEAFCNLSDGFGGEDFLFLAVEVGVAYVLESVENNFGDLVGLAVVMCAPMSFPSRRVCAEDAAWVVCVLMRPANDGEGVASLMMVGEGYFQPWPNSGKIQNRVVCI